MDIPKTLDDIRVDFDDAPSHVPKDRIVDISFAMGGVPNDLLDPYSPFDWLLEDNIPRLLYSLPLKSALTSTGSGTSNAGIWAVTRYEDIERVYCDNGNFSNKGTAEFQRLIGETFPSIPLAIDPPDHGKYRLFLMQYFGPSRITRDIEPQIRSIAIDMIEDIKLRGEVDIAWDFARVFPVRIFMRLMGFSDDMFDDFLAWEWDILHSNDLDKIRSSLRNVLDFLRAFMAEKEMRPDETLTSSIVNGTVNGEQFTDDEKIGMIWFLWLGGLDTVAATISQMFRRLALDPIIQHNLRKSTGHTNSAVEEFLRTQPILNTSRRATQDFEWHGMHITKGDNVLCLNVTGNFDPAKFKNPRTFDPTRSVNRHFTFVGGAHLCLGAHLARRELRVILEETLSRIPEFSVKIGSDTSVFPGLLSIRNLPLVWDSI